MKLKLINYNKPISTKGKHRVIIDDIKYNNSSNTSPTITILIGNEIGVLNISIDPIHELDILSQIYKSCDLSIPEDYIIETDDLKNCVLHLVLNKDIIDNNFTNQELGFELFSNTNSKKSRFLDLDDVPF